MSSLLSLPLELRYRLYGYIAVPDTEPFSSYLGLYLSCRQICVEMSIECRRLFSARLLSIQKSVRTGSFEIPPTYQAQQHIRIKLNHPFSSYSSCADLVPLSSLHLATLTLALVPEPSIAARTTHLLYWVMTRILRQEMNACRVIVEMPTVNKRQAIDWWDRMSVVPLQNYRFRWVVMPGRSVRALWELAGYDKGPCDRVNVVCALQGLNHVSVADAKMPAVRYRMTGVLWEPGSSISYGS